MIDSGIYVNKYANQIIWFACLNDWSQAYTYLDSSIVYSM